MRTIIFDLDGTLLNTLKDLGTCCNHTLKKYGFPEHSIEAYKYFVGNGMQKLVERVLPKENKNEEFVLKFKKDFLEYYSEHQEDFTKPYHGISELLNTLQNRYQLAIASNKIHEATQELVTQYFPEIKFSVVSGQKENILPKPNATIILEILEKTKSQPFESIMIGDSSVDINTAKNAGIKSIGVLWGFRTKEELQNAGADFLVEKPHEIIRILEEI